MMGFVQTDGPNTGSPHRVKNAEVPEIHCFLFGEFSGLRFILFAQLSLHLLHGAVQSLIGNGRDGFHLFQVVGKQGGRIISRKQKAVGNAFQPLLADGDAGGEDQAGSAQPANQFDSKGGFSGPRCRYNMYFMVGKIGFRICENPFLINPPFSLEL